MTHFRYSLVFALIIISSLFAGPSSALSCVRPDLLKSVNEAKNSNTVYYIFAGHIIPNNPVEYSVDPSRDVTPKPPKVVAAKFVGRSLAPNRQQDYVLENYPINVEISCISVWCGQLPAPTEEIIAIVEARPNESPVLTIGPCPGSIFPALERSVQSVRECLGADCQNGDKLSPF